MPAASVTFWHATATLVVPKLSASGPQNTLTCGAE